MELTADIIRSKVKSGDFLRKRKESPCDVWKQFSIVYEIKDGQTSDIFGWAVCNGCFTGLRTHSKRNGVWRNQGVTSLRTHASSCFKLKRISDGVSDYSKTDEGDTSRCEQSMTPASDRQSQSIKSFLYNKKPLPIDLKEKLKTAELKYIVGEHQSFQSIESKHLHHLLNIGIEIGTRMGKINIEDVLYGRKTVQEEMHMQFKSLVSRLKEIIGQCAAVGELSITTDMWSDRFARRSFLDVSAFWISDSWSLQHVTLKLRLFEHDSHTAENIYHELTDIFSEFGLQINDVPITTDAGSNFVSALKDCLRYQCAEHRLNTVLTNSYDQVKKTSPEFEVFDRACHDLVAYVKRTTGIQDKLPLTLKSASTTRAWRSNFSFFDSLNRSYDELRDALTARKEDKRLINVSQIYLHSLSELYSCLTQYFDTLEHAKIPTLQNVIPTYYGIVNFCSDDESDNDFVKSLKMNIRNGMNEKYWPIVTPVAKLATVLDPTFRNLEKLIAIERERKEILKDAKSALKILVNAANTDKELSSDGDDTHEEIEPPFKRAKNDPFAIFRKPKVLRPSKSGKLDWEREWRTYLQGSESEDLFVRDENPLLFWKANEKLYPTLCKVARKVLVIQASSSQSERVFSDAGLTLTAPRNRLKSKHLEELVTLKCSKSRTMVISQFTC